MHRILNVLKIFRVMLLSALRANRDAAGLEQAEAWRRRSLQLHAGCARLCDEVGIRIRVEGTIPNRAGMLVVANHFGVIDPVILTAATPMAPVARADLQRWPFVGDVSVSHGMIPVDRERRTAAVSFVERVRERLAAGLNVLVFPEGGTGDARPVRPFKTGVFQAVIGQEGGMVLPAYLSIDRVEGEAAADDGVRRRVVWLEHTSFWAHIWSLAALRSLDYTVRFGEPISAEGRDRKELAQLARNAVEEIRLSLHSPRS